MHRYLSAALVGLALALPPAAAQQQDPPARKEITLEEARALARAALAQGRSDLALQLGQGLLQANPNDADAFLIVSTAQAQKRSPAPGRQAARLAYRNATGPGQKLQAALLAARHNVIDNRLTATQIWLRRAALHTESEADKARIAQDYRRVRLQNPWSFHLDLGLRPSTNVNNGADTGFQVIDGVPLVGTLDGAAQALSGMVGRTNLAVGYRLHGDANSRTTVTSRTVVRRVWLSDEARDLAPDAKNSDFGSTYSEIALSHAFKIGGKRGNHAILTGAIGGSWFGEELDYKLARFDAERRWHGSDKMGWLLGASVVRRDDPDTTVLDNFTVGLRGGFSRKMDNGDRLTMTLGLQQTKADHDNLNYDSTSLSFGYVFAKPVGPARVSTHLTYTTSDYPDYSVGFITVPEGRQDEFAAASVSFFFSDYDYAGFAPELTVQASKRRSNVSRFDSTQTSISLGIRSKF